MTEPYRPLSTHDREYVVALKERLAVAEAQVAELRAALASVMPENIAAERNKISALDTQTVEQGIEKMMLTAKIWENARAILAATEGAE